jgi:demethylmenaquinone methyltransferase/2-methoxy-6-polyprenyl-1,4-benzoquinol methylase
MIAPRIGKAISGNAVAYQYLNDSVNAFPEGEVFINILKNSGYRNTYQQKLSQGICTIYCGTK